MNKGPFDCLEDTAASAHMGTTYQLHTATRNNLAKERSYEQG